MAQQATEWLLRMEKPTCRRDRAAFMDWVKESPKHLREFLLAFTWDQALSNLDPDRKIDVRALIEAASKNVVPVDDTAADYAVTHSQAEHRTRRSLRQWAGWGLAAAAVAGAAVALVWSGALHPVPQHNQLETATGELRSLMLEDGSLVYLASESSIRVELTDQLRNIYQSEGQASFAVAHDPKRPFRVHVGDAVVQAIGTSFDIRHRSAQTDVAVIEGVVSIAVPVKHEARDGATRQVRLTAGNGLSIGADGRLMPTMINAANVSAWQQRRIVLTDTPLLEVANEFNRYNRQQIRIEDAAIAARRYVGTFNLDEPGDLIEFISYTEDDVRVDRDGLDYVIRRASLPAAAKR